MFLFYSLIMLALLVVARLRTPPLEILRTPWFALSLLTGELPWLLAAIHLVVTLGFVTSLGFSSKINLVAALLALMTLWLWWDLHRRTFFAGAELTSALNAGLGADYSQHFAVNSPVAAPEEITQRRWLRPFAFARPGVHKIKNIAYGILPRQQLDIYYPHLKDGAALRPVVLHVHGGAWIVGHKNQQGKPLLHYLTENGWICVDINYRLAPRHRYPAALEDVKAALAWVKNNIANYGGNPRFIALAGESAGAHLSLLVGMDSQRSAEDISGTEPDTSVQALVALYGVYDLTNASNTWSGTALTSLLRRWVMPAAETADPQAWCHASPLHRVHEQVPPTLIIHGTHDALVFIEEARAFAATCRKTAKKPVVFAELKGAQHGFDLFHNVRTEYSITAVGNFLRYCYDTRQQ